MIIFHLGCLIPPEDMTSESAHYVAKHDTLSLTNFAILDEDEEAEFSIDNQSDENIDSPSTLSNHF